MASLPSKTPKANIQEDKETKESIETPTSVIASSLNAPKHGTVIPNRVFVGGISSATTENDLVSLFSNYGSVTDAKIIADRAGVSKGYGFVTFATEDEAKSVQKDADNIILRERRLNIAPAIKKQGYGRVHSYDCSPNTPVPIPSPVYRQNGVAYTFHNGMAFFPQPAPQAITSAHIDQAVYQQGPPPPFSSLPQGSPTPTYQYPYSQGPFIYQPHHQYPYHPLSYDGCFEPQLMVHDGNLVLPQYYVAPPTDITFYQATPMHSQDTSPLQPPLMYPSPRAYDPAIVCTSELPIESSEAPVQVQEADTSAANTVTTTSAARSSTNNEISTTTSTPPNENAGAVTRGKETPVVSLLKVYNNNNKEAPYHNIDNKGQGPNTYQSQGMHQNNHLRRKPRHPEEGRRVHLNNNNNNPDAANRNLVSYHHQGHHQRGPTGRKGSTGEGVPSDTSHPNPRHPFVPNYHPHYRLPPPPPPPPNHLSPFYNHQPTTHRTRSFFHRPRYGGPGGGRGGRHHHQRPEGGKWSSVKEEAQQPLTPPITPKSENGRGSTPTVQQQSSPDDLVKSMQTVVI